MTAGVRRARALRPGDRVAIASPSSPVLDRTRLERGLKVLRGWGLSPQVLPQAWALHGHLAGTDEVRAGDLDTAFRDPEVRAVIASRGGYGVTRILDRLDWGALRDDPKLLVGFSDVSGLLLAAWRRLRLVTVHGQFAGRYSLQQPQRLAHLKALLFGAPPGDLLRLDGRTLVPGQVQGRLVGGNLSLLATLVGTPDQADTRGAIVFLEEVAEPPYRLDRMLTQLLRAGLFRDVAGVAVGTFVDCAPGPDRPSLDVDEVVADRLGDLGVPVITDLPIGHVDHQIALPIGALATLDGDGGTLTLLEGATPANGD